MMEGRMLGKSIRGRTPEPSFYYVMLAAACFQGTARICHPDARRALRDFGCKYLAKARRGFAHERVPEFSLTRIRAEGAEASRRQSWTVD
jgi:hypothetical protein